MCVCLCVCVYPSKHIHVAVCGPIWTKFGTHMQIHLEKVVRKIKICPVLPRGEFGGRGVFRGPEIQTSGIPIGTKFVTRLRIQLGMDIG